MHSDKFSCGAHADKARLQVYMSTSTNPTNTLMRVN